MEHLLDVSELEPCEPMQQTLSAISRLEEGDYLRVLHRREPHPLYPMLEQAGFSWYLYEGGPTGFQLLIWKQDDSKAQALIAEMKRDKC